MTQSIKDQIPCEIYEDNSVCKYTIRDEKGKIAKQFTRQKTDRDIVPQFLSTGIKEGIFYGEWVDTTAEAIENELSCKKLKRTETAEQKAKLERIKELKRANEMLAMLEKMGITIEKKQQ